MLILLLLLCLLGSSILLESISDCPRISSICLYQNGLDYKVVIPYYLLSCYPVPHSTLLKDLINEEIFIVRRKKDLNVDIIDQKGTSQQRFQSPAFFVSYCNHSISIANPNVLSLLFNKE